MDFKCSRQALRALEDQIEADSKFGFDPGIDRSEEYSEAEDLPLCGKCELCKEARREEEADRREMAMEAGMLHGVDAFNEAMGWDVE